MFFGSNFWRGFEEYRPSAIALVFANCIPLFGVVFLGWDTFSIVVLYWTENVIIGAINVLKMITCAPDERAIDWIRFAADKQPKRIRMMMTGTSEAANASRLAHHASKLFFVPFFIVHYGLFCFVHGVFVFAIFGHDALMSSFGPLGPLSSLPEAFGEHRLWWGVVALAASHLYSYLVNFLWRGEFKRTFIVLLMMQPYARIVVLHLAILFGGIISMLLGSNVAVLVILIIGKTALDLHFHLLERLRDAGRAAQPQELATS